MPLSMTSKKYIEKYWTYHFEHCLKTIIELCEGIEVFCSQSPRQDIDSQLLNAAKEGC